MTTDRKACSCVLQDRDIDAVGQPQDGSLDVTGIQSCLLVLLMLRGGLEVLVWHHHWSEFQVALVEESIEGQEVQDVVSESSDAALLDGDQDAVVLGEFADQIHVEGLHETSVGNGDAQGGVLLFDLVSGHEGLVEAGSQGKNGDAVLAVPASAGVGGLEAAWFSDDASLSDWEDLACVIDALVFIVCVLIQS
eukprot:CAMPEP_0198116476 /NCGR_PEP_ID=MMETSP1442-20131203/12721_1 /TAXON_ID= /ORGANISM="Craspedostauros australis, Strain CCMP3328" /LENGTH=192 /DNA_ID=CAMNT_0043774301 /DNA_START=212 /DNA_END=786 /DNA_ORIENTATION=-